MAFVASIHYFGVSVKLLSPACLLIPSNSTGLEAGLPEHRTFVHAPANLLFTETMPLTPTHYTQALFYSAYLCRYQFFASGDACRRRSSGPIFDNRIFKHGGPHAGRVLDAVSEPESRFRAGVGEKDKINLDSK